MEMFDILEDIWKTVRIPLFILLALGLWKLINIIIDIFHFVMG